MIESTDRYFKVGMIETADLFSGSFQTRKVRILNP